MRVLLVNTSENAGGAAIAALRLLHALNKEGVEASMLVRDRARPVSDERVLSCGSRLAGGFNFVAERLGVLLSNGGSRRNLFAIDPATHGTDITRLAAFREADVVHLHWVNQGMLSLRDVRRILQSGKPVVWTLHDMWPLTGICHQAGDCKAWLTGCGDCPLLCHPGKADLSARTFLRKREAFGSGRICFAACSDWLCGLARKSELTACHVNRSIPNPIDTDFFAPGDKEDARRRLGLPVGKRVVLFVAFKATDPNKGIGYLREAVCRLAQRNPKGAENICVVPVGREAEKLAGTFSCEVVPFGYVTDRETMRRLYIAADVLAMPTLMDNLPNTIVEALACGLPCVGFNVGGLPQMIAHAHNGYLAAYKDAEDFSVGLEKVLGSADYAGICREARRTALDKFSEKAVAAAYVAYYRECMDGLAACPVAPVEK